MSEVVLDAEERRRFGELVAQLWSDDELAARYAAEPMIVLAERGIPAAAPLPVPAAPVEDVDDEALVMIGAVGGISTCGTASSISCPGCTAGTVGTADNCRIEFPH